jgi:hypothetical protein
MTMRDIGRTLDDGADAAHDLEHAANVRAVRGGDMEHDSAGSRGARRPDEGGYRRVGELHRDRERGGRRDSGLTLEPPSSAPRPRLLRGQTGTNASTSSLPPGGNGMRICLSRDMVIREHDVAREP